MSDRSAIEWTDATWNIRARNLQTGKIGWHCEHATTGCEFCYAEGFNKRLGTGLPFKPGHREDIEIFLDHEMLTLPFRWKKPRKIFVCSMTDLFADFVKDEWIDKMFAVMALCPQHTFQVLTKRADRMRRYLADHAAPYRIARDVLDLSIADKARWTCEPWPVKSIGDIDMPDNIVLEPWPLPNVWLGVSCERQEEADERIPLLLQTPAATRFISAEPLLGPIDLKPEWIRPLYQHRIYDDGSSDGPHIIEPALDWVIVGGESGPNARPMHPQWASDLRDQCQSAGVSFFFKQFGEFRPSSEEEWIADDGSHRHMLIAPDGRYGDTVADLLTKPNGTAWLRRVGKKAAGRLLDGREWNEFPQRTPA